MEFRFNNKLETGNRPAPENFLVRGDVVVPFTGDNIPGMCIVTSRRDEKNGKWGGTEWVVALLGETQGLALQKPLHHAGMRSCPTWAALRSDYRVPEAISPAALRAAVATCHSTFEVEVCQRLDDIQAQLEQAKPALPAPVAGVTVRVYLSDGSTIEVPVPAGTKVTKVTVS